MPIYRGRLIDPLRAVIERYSPAETRSEGAFDDDFRTPLLDTSTGARREGQIYLPEIELPAQIEDGAYEALRLGQAGDTARSDFVLVFHFVDLEDAGLVDDAGNALAPKKDDRLVRVLDVNGNVVITPRATLELYCTEARPGGGWLAKRRNLLIARFSSRPAGLTGG